MMNKQQEIEDLFSIFHDFEIKGVRIDSNLLTLDVEIPWGQNFKPAVLDYQIRVELLGCRAIVCEYYILKDVEANKPELHAPRESEKKKRAI